METGNRRFLENEVFNCARRNRTPPFCVGENSVSTARGAKWGLNVFIAQSVERATVNRKVTGSIPVKNDLEQLLELREPTVSRTLPSRKEGFKGNLGSPSVGIAQTVERDLYTVKAAGSMPALNTQRIRRKNPSLT